MATTTTSGPPRDEDEFHAHERPTFFVRPSDNVYSYFFFISPTESKKAHGHAWSWDIIMAYLLVALNFFMQAVLVYLVFHAVVLENVNWQNGILKLQNTGLLSTEQTTPCNDGAALCFVDNGIYTCAPPSIQLTGRWEELDTNRDGIWTLQEVTAAKEELQCKYAVNPVEVFQVLVDILKTRSNLIWLHPDVVAGTAIHLPYFEYAMGDLIMCGYRSEDMCSNLMQRGFFDAPLKFGTAPRVGTTINSAQKYCRNLLQPGGICENLLPSTYTVWKIQSEIECGAASYSSFKYENPGNGESKQLLTVDYGARQEYQLAQDPFFRVFKAIILFTWLLLMFVEFKEVYKIMTVVFRYPDAADFGDDAVLVEQDPSDPEDVRYRIQGITNNHRRSMAVLCALRCLITVALTLVGVSYIVKTNGYTDLLMNGVTLVFVATIASSLYNQVLREEIRDQCEDIKAIKVEMYGSDWLNRRPALLDMACVVFLFAVVYAVMQFQMNHIVLPVHTALECTCLSAGEKCFEANHFNRPWWDTYWKDTVPAIFKEVGQLKSQTPGAAAAVPAALAAQAGSKSVADLASILRDDRELENRVQLMLSKNQKLEQTVQDLEAQMKSMKGSKAATSSRASSSTSASQKALASRKKGKALASSNSSSTTTSSTSHKALTTKDVRTKHNALKA